MPEAYGRRNLWYGGVDDTQQHLFCFTATVRKADIFVQPVENLVSHTGLVPGAFYPKPFPKPAHQHPRISIGHQPNLQGAINMS